MMSEQMSVGTNRVMMCAPTSYRLEYEINPWMRLENRPDTGLAAKQWDLLYEVLKTRAGAEIELIPQVEGCPDMVFTANAGLVKGDIALLASFRHPQRALEEPHFDRWFKEHGYTVHTPPQGCKFEGEGDALFAGSNLVAGYLKRSDICSHRWMADMLSTTVLSLELVDDRWYHLDTCLLPLSRNRVAFYPGAFDEYAQTVIRHHYETIDVELEEALRFACNAVVVGDTVVLPSGCPKLEADLQECGYSTINVEMSEFLKSGGASKCLTLLLN